MLEIPTGLDLLEYQAGRLMGDDSARTLAATLVSCLGQAIPILCLSGQEKILL